MTKLCDDCWEHICGDCQEAAAGAQPELDYAEVCADRDRYIARCAELERRLEAVREVVK